MYYIVRICNVEMKVYCLFCQHNRSLNIDAITNLLTPITNLTKKLLLITKQLGL